MNYRAEIDGLRALAVLPVILFHAGFDSFSGGFVGVDVFFVISGYLITTIIISELADGSFTLANFYERRARRILPALTFVMLACLPFAWFWLKPSDLRDFGESLVAVSLFFSNILFWDQSGYFDTAAELKPLLHTWSLAVEEQYYILFPVFLILTWKLGVRKILFVLAIVFVASLGWAQRATDIPADPKLASAAFYLLPGRIWELLIGVFAAFYLKHKGHPRSQAMNQYLSIIGFLMIVYSIVAFSKDTPFPGSYALLPTIGTGCLILSAVPNTIVHRLLCLRPLVGLGLISYSAYLWHQPVLSFTRHRFPGEHSDTLLLGLCLASIAMAYVSWRWVEKPFRNRNRTTRKQIVRYSVLGIVTFSAIGLSLRASEGLRTSGTEVNPLISGGQIGHDQYRDYAYRSYPECEDARLLETAEVWDGQKRCQQTRSGDPSVALFGDSHAEHLFLGMADTLDLNLVYLISGGNPLLGEPSHEHLFEHVNANEHIDIVVYAIRWSTVFNYFGESKFREEVPRALQSFIEAGKQVVVVADTPNFTADASVCYYASRSVSPFSCGLDAAAFGGQRTYFPILAEITHELGLELVDPAALFCGEEGCSMIRDEFIMFRDSNHLNITGSQLVGKYIVNESRILSGRTD